MEGDDVITKAMKFDVFPCPEGDFPDTEAGKEERKKKETELRAEVRGRINSFRAVSRKWAAIRFGLEAAGADISLSKDKTSIQFKPDYKKGGKIETVVNAVLPEGKNKNPYQYIRDLLAQTGYVWKADAACYAIQAVDDWWKHPNQNVNAKEGWLALNGSKRLPQFMGLPIPFKRSNAVTSNVRFESFSIFLSWEPGRFVKFKLKPRRLKNGNTAFDPVQMAAYRKFIEGADGVEAKTCYLNMDRDGQFYIQISYQTLKKDAKGLDAAKVLEVAFGETEKEFILLSVPEGRDGRKVPGKGQALSIDQVRQYFFSVEETVAWLDRLKIQADRMETQKASCGMPKRIAKGEGHKKAFEAVAARLNGIARCRAAGARTWNHTWSKRIIEKAKAWGCGTIRICDLPKMFSPTSPDIRQGLLMRPWGWAEFKTILQNKSTEYGISLEKGE